MLEEPVDCPSCGKIVELQSTRRSARNKDLICKTCAAAEEEDSQVVECYNCGKTINENEAQCVGEFKERTIEAPKC